MPPGHNKRPHGEEGRPVRNASVPACHDDGHDDAHDADRGNEHGDPESNAVHLRSLAQPLVRRPLIGMSDPHSGMRVRFLLHTDGGCLG